MSKSKEQLLLCAEHAADYINKTGSSGFVNFILDMIDYVTETEQPDVEKVQTLYEILHNVKNSSLEVLGGGHRLKEAYIDFVENFLKLSKVSRSPIKYDIGNEEFKDLNLSELHYVLGWVRRLVKAQRVSRAHDRNMPVRDRVERKGKLTRGMKDFSPNDRNHRFN